MSKLLGFLFACALAAVVCALSPVKGSFGPTSALVAAIPVALIWLWPTSRRK